MMSTSRALPTLAAAPPLGLFTGTLVVAPRVRTHVAYPRWHPLHFLAWTSQTHTRSAARTPRPCMVRPPRLPRVAFMPLVAIPCTAMVCASHAVPPWHFTAIHWLDPAPSCCGLVISRARPALLHESCASWDGRARSSLRVFGWLTACHAAPCLSHPRRRVLVRVEDPRIHRFAMLAHPRCVPSVLCGGDSFNAFVCALRLLLRRALRPCSACHFRLRTRLHALQ